jgi:hypothetical protein
MMSVNLEVAGSAVVGRESELSVLLRVLEEHGPRVCFVYGFAGIGKSSLLSRFASECERRGVGVARVDCRSIEPTESGFYGGLATALGAAPDHATPAEMLTLARRRLRVVIVDTYELFRLADPWLRHELLPALGPTVRVVVAGREPPMLEWSVERGQLGGLEILPLGPLDDEHARTLIRDAGLEDDPAADEIVRISRGHPLALRLALEARLAGGEMPAADAMPKVVDALAGAFREGLNERDRRALDAAAVPRRITRGVLGAMLGDEADAALDVLGRLAFVEVTSEGLNLHDAVQGAVVTRLRAVEPERFRGYRAAAWRHLQSETRGVARHELARSTADLLFLIDNPFVREAMFPTTAHAHSVEPARADDAAELRALWHRHDPPEAARVLDRWIDRIPGAVRAIRDRTGALVGCSIVAEWRDVPRSLERDDPVMRAWAEDAARHPLPGGQTTLVHRRFLARDTAEGPSGPQAAALLDVKRDYFRMRPQLGRLYLTLADPAPFADALRALGFRTFDHPTLVGDDPFSLLALDFGPESVDGWLSRIAATELGIDDGAFIDPHDRSVDLGDRRAQLSPLEFGVLAMLAARRGHTVSRADLIEGVWGTTYTGGSNVVDVVVRSLRRKLGPIADRVETVRGIGYRLS